MKRQNTNLSWPECFYLVVVFVLLSLYSFCNLHSLILRKFLSVHLLRCLFFMSERKERKKKQKKKQNNNYNNFYKTLGPERNKNHAASILYCVNLHFVTASTPSFSPQNCDRPPEIGAKPSIARPRIISEKV